jgi:hypothetical protein
MAQRLAGVLNLPLKLQKDRDREPLLCPSDPSPRRGLSRHRDVSADPPGRGETFAGSILIFGLPRPKTALLIPKRLEPGFDPSQSSYCTIASHYFDR